MEQKHEEHKPTEQQKQPEVKTEAKPKKLTGEARVDAIVEYLRTHGIHLPEDLSGDKEKGSYQVKHYSDGTQVSGFLRDGESFPEMSPAEQDKHDAAQKKEK